VKELKSFRFYVFHSKIISYVPRRNVKDMHVRPDNEGKRGKRLVKLLEYDVEIKPTKLIKGQVLERFLADSNCKAIGLNYIQNQQLFQYHNIKTKMYKYWTSIIPHHDINT
jgi:hypothetical protein